MKKLRLICCNHWVGPIMRLMPVSYTHLDVYKRQHVYNGRIYVTVNTILKDEELKDTEKMIWDLYRDVYKRQTLQ